MASGPTVGGDEGPREKQKCLEHKVYTRRAVRGAKHRDNDLNASPSATAAPLSAEANTTTASIVTADPSVTANSSEKKDDGDKGNIDNGKSNNSDTVGNNEDSINEGKGEDQKRSNDNFVSLEQAGGPEDKNLTQHPVVTRVEVFSDDSMSLNHRLDGTSNTNSLQVEPLNANHHQEDEPFSSYRHQQDEPRSSYCQLQEDPLSSSLHRRDEPLSSYPRQTEESLSISHNQKDGVASMRVLPSGNGSVEHGLEGMVKTYLGSRSKHEISNLRRKLESDLDIVRNLMRRIEAKQGQISRYGNSSMLVSNGGGAKRSHSEVSSGGLPWVSRPFHQVSASVTETIQERGNNVEKEKRTPKANQFYRNSEFLLGKDKFPPAESNKKSKSHSKKHVGRELGHAFGIGTKFWKSCSSLLDKLMKHKHSWVFNTPVDVNGLGLHDYYSIISHPMDLGTVKSRLNSNWYKSPEEFAEDVRLTFRNAMTYNPKGQDVHIMAEQLSKTFEDRWTVIESDYNRELRNTLYFGTGVRTTIPLFRKAPLRPPPLDMRRILHRSESMTHSVERTRKPMTHTPTSRTPAPRKPKANDPHKRDMTYEEKQKLSTNLQGLPSDKLDAIVQIIKRRNSSLFQQDDEIEVDIDSVDAETLWELDRFVTNYKKRLSKHKRKAELASLARAEAVQSLSEGVQGVAQVPKEIEADERTASLPLPTLGEKQVDNGNISSSSSSSSSDSGSSSSSDSDTESSSGSDSDAGSPRR